MNKTRPHPTAEFGKPSTELLIPAHPAKSVHRNIADFGLNPVNLGGIASKSWAEKTMGEIGINEAVEISRERAAAAANGDLDAAKAMLITQAATLDAIFNEMARKAAGLIKVNEGGSWTFTAQTMDAVTRVMFKAQSQCRTTLQTLGDLVNPRSVAFIKQTNNANGPQQVVNGVPPASALAPAEESENRSNELGAGDGGKVLELGAAEGTGGIDPPLEALAKLDRAKVGAGKGSGRKEQPKARGTIGAVH
jgi:hypothetical protein